MQTTVSSWLPVLGRRSTSFTLFSRFQLVCLVYCLTRWNDSLYRFFYFYGVAFRKLHFLLFKINLLHSLLVLASLITAIHLNACVFGLKFDYISILNFNFCLFTPQIFAKHQFLSFSRAKWVDFISVTTVDFGSNFSVCSHCQCNKGEKKPSVKPKHNYSLSAASLPVYCLWKHFVFFFPVFLWRVQL